MLASRSLSLFNRGQTYNLKDQQKLASPTNWNKLESAMDRAQGINDIHGPQPRVLGKDWTAVAEDVSNGEASCLLCYRSKDTV